MQYVVAGTETFYLFFWKTFLVLSCQNLSPHSKMQESVHFCVDKFQMFHFTFYIHFYNLNIHIHNRNFRAHFYNTFLTFIIENFVIFLIQ